MIWTTYTQGGPRRVNHAAAAVGKLIYSFGGYCTGEDFDNPVPIDVHVLDTRDNRWEAIPAPTTETELSATPYRRFGHSVVAYKTSIFLFGGRNNIDPSDTLYEFNTVTLTWSRPVVSGYSMPEARDGHSACVIDNCMYMFGGFLAESNAYSDQLYRLDLEQMKWQLMANVGNPPPPRDFHTASVVGNCMYIFGGRGNESDHHIMTSEIYFRKIYVFDTIKLVWSAPDVIGNPPIGRRSHSSFVYNNLIYFVGGFNGNLRQHFNTGHVFNPATNKWSDMVASQEGPCKRRRHSSVLVGNRMYLFGGTGPQRSQTSMEIYYMIYNSEDSDASDDSDEETLRLIDHNDLHILDFAPTLVTLSLVAMKGFYDMATLEENLPKSLLARYKLMVENNTISRLYEQ